VLLTKNTYSTTKYVSFFQVHFISGIDSDEYDLSNRLETITTSSKTANNYKVRLNCDRSYTVSFELWCVTFYIQEKIAPLVTNVSMNYNVNGSPYLSDFPQHVIHQEARSGTIDIYNLLTEKLTTDKSYFNFGSIENENSDYNNVNINQIIYYENPKVADYCRVALNTTGNRTITVNTITMYVPPISQNNFISNYNVNGFSLEQTFPICETFVLDVGGANKRTSYTFTLGKNTRGTTNYVVMTSYRYDSNGDSSGTYNPWEASSSVRQLIILNKTTTTFKVAFYRSDGDKWVGGVKCLVIYY